MGTHHAEQTIVVDAPPGRCFDVLVDYERIPEWQSAVRECEVLRRDRDGRGVEVAFVLDAKVRTVRYTLAYRYSEPHEIACDLVEGDLKALSAVYRLDDDAAGGARATYALRIDPGLWVPGRIASMLRDQVMRTAMAELKARVEAVTDPV